MKNSTPVHQPLVQLAHLLARLQHEDETERLRRAVEEGLADIEAGRVLSDEEMGRWIEEQFPAEP